MGKAFYTGSLNVQAVDFVDEDTLIAEVIFPDIVNNNQYGNAMVLVNFRTSETTLLHDYTLADHTGRHLYPLKILHPKSF